MIQKTKDYQIFKFRKDNRFKIDETHINKIMESIKSCNLLELRPISVNKDMEIIDGQNRLLAAQRLGVEIYYQVSENLNKEDIILMNVSKPWGMIDYLNFYYQNGYEEYIKLQEFMNKNKLSLIVALNITMGKKPSLYDEFKKGNYKYNEAITQEKFSICIETINYIKKMCNYRVFTNSARFWSALLTLVNHPEFNAEKWRTNYERMVERFGPRATVSDYLKCFMEIYNYKNLNKISTESLDMAKVA